MPIQNTCTCGQSLTGFCARDIRECKQLFLTEMDNCYMEEKKSPFCTLTDAELIEKANELIQELIDTGGKSWALNIPARPNADPDLIFMELNTRFKKLVSEGKPAATWTTGHYDRLYDQVKSGKRTVCYVISGECWDICTVDPEELEFGARGISYGRPRPYIVHQGMSEKEAFIRLCEERNVEWLDESGAIPSGEREIAFAEWAGWDWRRVEGKNLWENQKTLEVMKTAQLYELFKQKDS
jgi:hypothetical protein